MPVVENNHRTPPPKKLVVEWTTCCGLTELYGLEYTNAGSVKAALDKFLEETENFSHTGIFATTIACQHAGRALRANKFRPVARWRNPNSGNMVTMWFRKPGK